MLVQLSVKKVWLCSYANLSFAITINNKKNNLLHDDGD